MELQALPWNDKAVFHGTEGTYVSVALNVLGEAVHGVHSQLSATVEIDMRVPQGSVVSLYAD